MHLITVWLIILRFQGDSVFISFSHLEQVDAIFAQVKK